MSLVRIDSYNRLKDFIEAVKVTGYPEPRVFKSSGPQLVIYSLNIAGNVILDYRISKAPPTSAGYIWGKNPASGKFLLNFGANVEGMRQALRDLGVKKLPDLNKLVLVYQENISLKGVKVVDGTITVPLASGNKNVKDLEVKVLRMPHLMPNQINLASLMFTLEANITVVDRVKRADDAMKAAGFKVISGSTQMMQVYSSSMAGLPEEED